MYEERKNGFSIRDILIQLLLVVLFVVIVIWLFPTKSYLANKYADKDYVDNALDSRLEALYGRLFADNMDSMKEAAKDYFTTPRLPKNIGDSVTLTLGEMLEKKLVLDFKDSNNQTCNKTDSYVKITKMDDEYQMRVQLSCSDYNDYIIVYMGCYEYCDTAICQPKAAEKPVSKPTNPGTSKPGTSTPDNKPKPIDKNYEYEYRLTNQNEYSNWTNWSNWSTNKITASNLKQVEIRTDKTLTGYEQIWAIIGYKTETYTDYDTITKYRYETREVQVGTATVPGGTIVVDTKPVIASSSGGYYTGWVNQGYITSKVTLSTSVNSNSKVKYVYVSEKTTVDCSNVCKNVTTYTYKKSTRNYVNGSTTTSCASYGSSYVKEGNKCVKYGQGTKVVPVYKTVTQLFPYTEKIPVTKTREVAVYGYKNGNPIYKTVTEYRYRTRELIKEAGTVYKWSRSDYDTDLIKQGYSLTGNQREV